MKQLSTQQALAKLKNLCARGEHSAHEMRQKLRLWGIDAAESQRVIDQLIDERYVDDTRFASLFVRDKLRFNHWGRNKIAQALRMKGISDDIVREALTQVSDDDYADELRKIVESKRRSISSVADEPTRRRKLMAFALQRGFTFDEIKRVIGDDIDGFYED